ncbi:MAG: ABC transporter permease [bacterium]
MNWLRIALLNLKLVVADRTAVCWMLLMPLVFTYVFGMAYRPRRPQDSWVPVANFDGGRMSQFLINQLKSPGFNITLLSPEQRDDFDNRPHTLVIPEGFTDKVLAGEKGELYLVLPGETINSSRSMSVGVHLFEILGKVLPGMVRVQFMDRIKSGLDPWEDLEKEVSQELQVKVEVRNASNVTVPPSGFSFTSVSYLVLFVLINTVIYGGVSLAEERRGGQFRRLVTSPVSRMEILSGMVLGRWFVGMAQIFLLVAVTFFLFHINWGANPAGLVLVVSAFAFACASLGMLIGSRVKGADQAILLGVVGGNVMGALGGCWFPIEMMPENMRYIAYCFPTGWALDALHGVVSWNHGTLDILPEILMLLLFGLVFLTLAVRALKWE